jgi:hypothetical protein
MPPVFGSAGTPAEGSVLAVGRGRIATRLRAMIGWIVDAHNVHATATLSNQPPAARASNDCDQC